MSKEAKYTFNFLSVGQGNLQLIEEGDQHNIIIDCNLQGADEFVKRYFGRRKVEKIDLLILSGTDEDHADADGLEFLMKNYPIERVWVPEFEHDTDNWKAVLKLLDELQDSGAIVESPKAGAEVTIGTMALKVLGPKDAECATSNAASIVVRVSTGEVRGIFPGDCDNACWEEIQSQYKSDLPASILLASHHGSNDGCHESSLKVINPEYTVISVGEDNQYGHPDKEAVALYEKHTREEVFQTKDDGSLMFESDGKTIIKVITDAGQDPEGKKEAARALAAAVGSGTPIFVSRTGSLSTNAIGTVAPSRPTVFHGGREAPVADDSEGV